MPLCAQPATSPYLIQDRNRQIVRDAPADLSALTFDQLQALAYPAQSIGVDPDHVAVEALYNIPWSESLYEKAGAILAEKARRPEHIRVFGAPLAADAPRKEHRSIW